MRLVFVSDTHCQMDLVQVPAGDVLVHCGDWTYRGTDSEVRRFAEQMGRLPHPVKLAIAGNHDWLAQKEPELCRAILASKDVLLLQDSGTAVEGVRFWGSPWQPRFHDWAFNLPRGDRLAEKWALIPEHTDVLVTHGPPFGTLDQTSGEYGAPENVGCRNLRLRINELNLKVHAFGHIHGQNGQVKVGNTLHVNASICDESYKTVQPAQVVDL